MLLCVAAVLMYNVATVMCWVDVLMCSVATIMCWCVARDLCRVEGVQEGHRPRL